MMIRKSVAHDVYGTAVVAAMLMYFTWLSWAGLIAKLNDTPAPFHFMPEGMLIETIAVHHIFLFALLLTTPNRTAMFTSRLQVMLAAMLTSLGVLFSLMTGLWLIALALGVACIAAVACALPAVSRQGGSETSPETQA